jgi:hypothetical protein
MEASTQPRVKQVTTLMRWNLLIGSALPFLAGLSLFVGTNETDRYSAWTIHPAITAAFIGGAYWAGFCLTFVSGFERAWANARIAIPAVMAFTVCNLISTIVHYHKFHVHSGRTVTQLVTYVWLVPYAAGLAFLLIVIALQLRTPGGDPTRVAELPSWLRAVLALQALALVGVGLALMIAPLEVANHLWPWKLTALTGRVVGAWLLALGVGAAQVAIEDDWRRARAAALSYAVFGAIEFVVLARYTSNFDFGAARTWVYIAAIGSILLVGLYSTITAWKVASQQADGLAIPAPLSKSS